MSLNGESNFSKKTAAGYKEVGKSCRKVKPPLAKYLMGVCRRSYDTRKYGNFPAKEALSLENIIHGRAILACDNAPPSGIDQSADGSNPS